MSAWSPPADHYAVLQVHREAEPETITAVYRYLARRYHPDRAAADGRAECEERLRALNEAYRVLSDPEQRRDYDAAHPAGGGASPFLVQFEAAACLAEAAAAGGSREECYRRSAGILERIIAEAGRGTAAREARERLLDIQLNGLQRFDLAAETLKQLLEETPRGAERDALQLALARCHCRLKRWNRALRTYDRVIEECVLPEVMLQARVDRADVLDANKQPDQAIEAFALVARTYPGTPAAGYAQYRRGRILDSTLARYPEAIQAYRAVVREHPETEWARDCPWRIEYLQKRHLEGKGWFEAMAAASQAPPPPTGPGAFSASGAAGGSGPEGGRASQAPPTGECPGCGADLSTWWDTAAGRCARCGRGA